jgi:UDP-4-amino-4,6-dideoxy-N-acetyl-beta-L-altrosamine transaminase
MIPYGRQDISQEDIDAVLDVLGSDFLTQGPKVPLFEQAVCSKVGAKHGLAVNSATSALHIACLALGLGEGDYLWTSPITFVASANCGLYCGAKVDFVDIDPRTYNLCPKALEEKLIGADRVGKLPKIIVPVHFCGQSCDMKAIYALSQKYGFKIIEDASHAIGGKYLDKYIGSCRYSDITVFSFHPVKIITTAEGGMALTNNHELASRMNLFRSHGITRDPDLMTGEPDGPWYYQQIELGFNYRMTELQAALGISQLFRLDEFVARRHQLASGYRSDLSSLPLLLPHQNPDACSSFHLYVVQLKLDQLTSSHKEIFERLRSKNIGVNLHYIPLYEQPYAGLRKNRKEFPNANTYYSNALSLPLFSSMTDHEQKTVVRVISECLT